MIGYNIRIVLNDRELASGHLISTLGNCLLMISKGVSKAKLVLQKQKQKAKLSFACLIKLVLSA